MDCSRRGESIYYLSRDWAIQTEFKDFGSLSLKCNCKNSFIKALLQCWVVKDTEVTDHMVEAVEYFARLTTSLYEEGANVVLSKLAVS